jgi:hypothetical protein
MPPIPPSPPVLLDVVLEVVPEPVVLEVEPVVDEPLGSEPPRPPEPLVDVVSASSPHAPAAIKRYKKQPAAINDRARVCIGRLRVRLTRRLLPESDGGDDTNG